MRSENVPKDIPKLSSEYLKKLISYFIDQLKKSKGKEVVYSTPWDEDPSTEGRLEVSVDCLTSLKSGNWKADANKDDCHYKWETDSLQALLSPLIKKKEEPVAFPLETKDKTIGLLFSKNQIARLEYCLNNLLDCPEISMKIKVKASSLDDPQFGTTKRAKMNDSNQLEIVLEGVNYKVNIEDVVEFYQKHRSPNESISL